MVDINSIRSHIIKLMQDELPETLYYHSIEHTLDVELCALSIAAAEGINDKEAIEDLQIASLYHDTGFIKIHLLHETVSCEYARKFLPGFGLDDKRIDNICSIIMATKFPHQPCNLLEEIICDADLDYLGRTEFSETSEKLRKELVAFGIINSDTNWNQYQLEFLKKHRFFTASSIASRESLKLKHIQEIENNLLKGNQ